MRLFCCGAEKDIIYMFTFFPLLTPLFDGPGQLGHIFIFEKMG